jgi:2-C-methyl-D-erythritol 2,4-cyclodiphosphate synthase
VIAEEPRIGPHAQAMRRSIAENLGNREQAVSVKATTNEGMGFVGRGEGIAALAIATIESSDPGGSAPHAPMPPV